MQEIHVEYSGDRGSRANAWVSHAVPFIAWLFIMQLLGDPAGWKYAVRTLVCLGLFLWLRPWVWYPRIQWRNLPLALAVGVGVCVAWVGFESSWFQEAFPRFHDIYIRYGVLPWGELREPMTDPSPYNPSVCGWPLTLMRIAGSALVIGVIEEFFWRGFLYRWFARREWLDFDPPTFERTAFFMIAVVFALEHVEWAGGLVAGLAYAWMYIRTGDLWSVALAHAITNGLLGAYVVATASYQFW